MRRVLKWVAATLVVIVVAVLGWIYGGSELELRKKWKVPAVAVAVPSDSATVAAGEIVARTRGCIGCHGGELVGKVFFDEPRVARVVASNLTRVAASTSDAELARMIRHGVRPDGRALLGMPSQMFYHLSDADVGNLIAYIRSRPVVEDTLPRREVRFLGRLGLVLNEFDAAPELIDHAVPRLGNSPEAVGSRRGEYLVRTTCTECHGMSLEGDDGTPGLGGAVGYSEEEFLDLVRNGAVKGGRQLDLMASVLQSRLRYYPDEDLRVIHAYLKAYRPTGP